jgi:hypothetical protein
VCSSFRLANQQKGGENKNLKFIAVDIGKRDCKACIMSSDGSIAEEIKYDNTLHEAEIFAYSIVRKYGGHNILERIFIAFRKFSRRSFGHVDDL